MGACLLAAVLIEIHRKVPEWVVFCIHVPQRIFMWHFDQAVFASLPFAALGTWLTVQMRAGTS